MVGWLQILRALVVMAAVTAFLGGCGEDIELRAAHTFHESTLELESWVQHDEFSGVRTSEGPAHGTFVAIWMNQIAAAERGIFSGTFPVGAAFFKRTYEDLEGEISVGSYTGMEKVKRSDGALEWQFYQVSDLGEPVQWGGGARGACAGCHSRAASTDDWIMFSAQLPSGF